MGLGAWTQPKYALALAVDCGLRRRNQRFQLVLGGCYCARQVTDPPEGGSMFLWNTTNQRPVSNLDISKRVARPTLVFAITTLNFLVYAPLNFAFENPSSRRFIKPRCFENMCCVYPIVFSSSHHTIAVDFELVNRMLRRMSVAMSLKCARNIPSGGARHIQSS